MEITIRKYQKDDFVKFTELSSDDWGIVIKQIASSLLKDNDVELCLCAEIDDSIIGFVYGFVLPNGTLILEFLYVKDEYRNKGNAKKLLKAIEDESGCSVSMVFYNKELHSFYEKQEYNIGDNLEIAMKTLDLK